MKPVVPLLLFLWLLSMIKIVQLLLIMACLRAFRSSFYIFSWGIAWNGSIFFFFLIILSEFLYLWRFKFSLKNKSSARLLCLTLEDLLLLYPYTVSAAPQGGSKGWVSVTY